MERPACCNFISKLDGPLPVSIIGSSSRRRDCHFTDTPSPSILKRLLKGQGGAAE